MLEVLAYLSSTKELLRSLIHIEDLNIKDDEVVIVNSMVRFKKVKDESFEIDSPRNRVLKLIRQIKPQVFIQEELCRSYSSYFLTRFRQVLSTYCGNCKTKLWTTHLAVHKSSEPCKTKLWTQTPSINRRQIR
ncbi:Scarecrow-like protein 33 [Carex littledalei]|uniref:Scarecrow-like protein 33 n=1 Tax=Carex littledalei TaxID=544730 RepID=A0A833QNE7_9POAL|nr:Scarecrow-like protein 33 [Carex littledalei]